MSTERARELRNAMTSAERKLWQALRNRQVGGHRFRRQHPVGPYFADFIRLERRLIVEVDGGQHGEPEQMAHDQRRTAWLSGEGYRVVRFWTTEVYQNLPGVIALIARDLEAAGQ